MRPASPPLSLLSLNVNGLNCAAKRTSLFTSLQEKRFDVVLLQETHHGAPAEGERWAQGGLGARPAWAGPSFWSHGSSASRGVAILVKGSGLAQNPTLLHNSADGRICAITFTYLDTQYSLFNVYAPSGSDTRVKQAFFRHALLPLLPAHSSRLLIGGDFNCVESGLDCSSGQAGARLAGFEGGLQEVIQQHDLLDAWRDEHARRRGFTHLCTTGNSAARLDRWYVSRDLPRWVHAPRKPVTGLVGDHLGVRLTLRPPQPPVRGPGAWSLPQALLGCHDFQEAMRQLISEVLARPVSEFGGSQGLRYVHLKECVKRAAMLWGGKLAAEQKAARRLLSARVDRALERVEADPACPQALAEFRAAQAELQASEGARAAKIALHAGLVDQHFGERSTHYFYQAAKIRGAQTSFPAIRADPSQDAQALDSELACLRACEIVADYYDGDHPQGLYRTRHVDEPAQLELLAALDCRAEQAVREAAEGMDEGVISLDELSDALAASARGHSPGPDGLPYEFYRAFWELLGPALAAVLREVFVDPLACLPPSLTQGRITLLHKPGKDKTLVASYRPITLLNADYKLIARVVSQRLGPALNSVVDPTQTAFLPDRWIGDNVSAHLEEIEYLQEAQEPGVIAFLDFEKAFDRVDRGWVDKCLEAMGMGPRLRRWVSLLHTNTSARVGVNGFQTRAFVVRSGVFQGSPLSPLLYVATTQPMAAHARSLQRRGMVDAIALPDGRPAPLLHLHADDTSLHTRTLEGLERLLSSTIQLHCRATAAKLQPSKSQGIQLGVTHPISGPHPGTGIVFVGPGETIRHLGILHSHTPAANAERMYEALLARMERAADKWARSNLTLIGRVHVAKQVLVSMLSFLASFIAPPPHLLQRMLSLVHTYVASGRVTDGGDTTRCRLFPRREVSRLPVDKGGLGLPDLRAHIQSLLAKQVARWLEPERLPWKEFFGQWLSRSSDWLAAHPAVPGRRHDRWQLGAFLPFSAYDLARLEVPPRVRAYLQAYAGLAPHRLTLPGHTPAPERLVERLFYNEQICGADGKPLGGPAWAPWADAGVTSLWHLRDHIQRGRAELPRWGALWAALPAAFREAVGQQSPVTGWLLNGDAAEARVARLSGGEATLYRVGPTGRLLQGVAMAQHPSLPVADWQPALVMSWDEGRSFRGSATYVEEGGPPFLLGPLSHVALIPALWGRGTFPAHALVVKLSTQRQLLLASMRDPRLRLQPGHALKPVVWSAGVGDAHAGIADLEARWAEAGGCSQESQEVQYLPRLYFPSNPRAPPRDRSAAPAQVVGLATRGRPRDEADPVAPRSHSPLSTAYSRAWKELSQPDIARPARLTAWRLMHGSLMVGAFRQHVHQGTLPSEEADCPHACCQGLPATLSHTFLQCPPVARVVCYVQSLWKLIDPAAPPLLGPCLLTGDPRHWAPSSAFQALWVRLRVYFLQAVWSEVQRAKGGGAVACSRALAGSMIHACHVNMRQDWLLATSGFRAEHADCPTQQLRGLSPTLSKELFFNKWSGRGLLCSETPEGHLKILWSIAAPILLSGS